MAEKARKRKSFSLKKYLSEKRNIPAVIITILLVGVFVFFGVSVVNQNADIDRLEIQKQELAQKLESQNRSNEELQAVLDSDNKDDYIEQKAREKGYVKSDEIVFYDVSSGK